MSQKHLLISRKLPQHATDLLKAAGFQITQWPEAYPMTPDQLIAKAQQVDALLASAWDKLDANFFEQASHLDIISQFSVGYDNIDIEAAKKHGVVIANTPGVLSNATADIAFGLMIAASRNMFQNHKTITSRQWTHADLTSNLGLELDGKTLGIFGLGHIGYLMAKKCVGAYNMHIIYHNRSHNEQAEQELGARYVSFEDLLAESDVISVHSNLTPETQQLFDERAFKKMKPNAIFVNSARGKIHDEIALTQALKNNTIWGAGLDVTNPEPMDQNNPLLHMPNVCVLPHVGSATETARFGMSDLAARNLIQFYEGSQVENQVI